MSDKVNTVEASFEKARERDYPTSERWRTEHIDLALEGYRKGWEAHAAHHQQKYSHLIPGFLQAMNDIGAYGHEKYGEQSFQHRRLKGDISRGNMERTRPEVIAAHAAEHFSMHLRHIPHDHFGTRSHQLAAVAFNAMMEFWFSGLSSESDRVLPKTTNEASEGFTIAEDAARNSK